jgi:hypothetical protein
VGREEQQGSGEKTRKGATKTTREEIKDGRKKLREGRRGVAGMLEQWGMTGKETNRGKNKAK